MEQAAGRPAITLTIATNDGWSVVRTAYDPVRVQASTDDTEILLIDSSGGAAPAAEDLAANTRWIEMPGADIAQMRMRGYRDGRGELLAMIEDHTVVSPDWIATMVDAHRAHPDAAAVGGGVRNGSPENVVDWASFYAGHAPFIAPLPTGPAVFLDGAYISYKREPLHAALDRLGGDRAIETLVNEEIKAGGGVLYADDRLYVSHFQSRGVMGTTRLHFHAGRHFEGTRRASRRDGPVRLLRAVALPLPRVAKRLNAARKRGQPIGRLARVAPAMLMIFSSQAAGEVTGILRGPGESAKKIH